MAAAPALAAAAPGAAAAPAAHTSASLYVGDLHPEVTESNLFELFNQVGPVASIRVCRDTLTRRSLQYAYVNFHNPHDAERALDALNYSQIKGQTIRIMWSQRDPSKRKSGVGNIIIKNLDKAIDHKALHDTFSTFGNILSCKVAMDQDHVSRGYGFVHFETAQAAEAAINGVNGMLLNGQKVVVEAFNTKKAREVDENGQPKFTNVFVKNLAPEVTDDILLETLSKFGPITKGGHIVMKDKDGKSRGFGFVNFEHPEDAKKAVQEGNGMMLNGKAVYAARAQKKSEHEKEKAVQRDERMREREKKSQGANLYVKNLDDSIDNEKMRQEFSKFGTITSAVVARDEQGKSKGFGYVCFSTPEEAMRAITEMNNKMLGSKPLYVALHQRKSARAEMLHTQYARPAAPMPAFYPGGPVMYQPGMPPQVGPRGGFMFAQAPMMPRGQPWQQGPRGVPGGAVQYPYQRGMARGPRGGRADARTPFQMRAGTRNAAQVMPMQQPVVATASPQMPPPMPELTPAYLESLTPAEQKNAIGTRLYALIQPKNPQQAGQITGMLLEGCEQPELLQLITVPEALDAKVQEALNVLATTHEEAAAAAAAPEAKEPAQQ